MFEQIPKEVLQQAWEQAGLSDDSTNRQMGIAMTKAFYQELGVDVGKIQSDYIFTNRSFDASSHASWRCA